MRRGLVPYECYEETEEKTPLVFLWGSLEDAERFARHKYDGHGAYDSEPYAILEVRLPSNIKPVRREIKNPEARKAGWKYEYLVKQRIPKNCLKIAFMTEIDTERFRRFKKELKKAGLLK